jgi:hypothetical protein
MQEIRFREFITLLATTSSYVRIYWRFLQDRHPMYVISEEYIKTLAKEFRAFTASAL